MFGNMGVNKNHNKEYVQEFTNYPHNLLRFKTAKGLHPTQKPVALFKYLIKTYTNEGDLVLDNCAGSGTTGVACKNLKRNFILMELDEKYCEIAIKRMEEHSQQSTLLPLAENSKEATAFLPLIN